MDRGSERFEAGQTVYTPGGQRALYVGVIGKQHFVRRLIGVENYGDSGPAWMEEWPEDYAIPVDKVFASEPQPLLGDAARRAQADLAELRRRVDEERDNLKLLAAQREELGRAVAKYPDLQTALDFAEGRITHFAITDGRYSTAPGVMEFREFMQDRAGLYGDKGMKLLCLFGTDPQGKRFGWSANRYRDDSGEWFTVVPCKSQAEAEERVREAFAEAVAQWREDGKGYEAARFDKCNIELERPRDYLEWRAANRARQRDDEIAKLRAKIAVLEGEA